MPSPLARALGIRNRIERKVSLLFKICTKRYNLTCQILVEVGEYQLYVFCRPNHAQTVDLCFYKKDYSIIFK